MFELNSSGSVGISICHHRTPELLEFLQTFVEVWSSMESGSGAGSRGTMASMVMGIGFPDFSMVLITLNRRGGQNGKFKCTPLNWAL